MPGVQGGVAIWRRKIEPSETEIVGGEREEKGGETSKASDGCFIKDALYLLGIPTMYLASLHSATCLPKGHIG